MRVQVQTGSARIEQRQRQRIAVGLAWPTIAWNTIEAVVAIVAGAAASSMALAGFGLTQPSKCCPRRSSSGK